MLSKKRLEPGYAIRFHWQRSKENHAAGTLDINLPLSGLRLGRKAALGLVFPDPFAIDLLRCNVRLLEDCC